MMLYVGSAFVMSFVVTTSVVPSWIKRLKSPLQTALVGSTSVVFSRYKATTVAATNQSLRASAQI